MESASFNRTKDVGVLSLFISKINKKNMLQEVGKAMEHETLCGYSELKEEKSYGYYVRSSKLLNKA